MRTKLAFCLTLFLSINSLAATVQSIKGSKLLLQLEGQNVQVGDRYFLLDGAGKKKAIVTIRQIKAGRAVAELNKGTPQTGYKLSVDALASASASANPRNSSAGSTYSKSGRASSYTGNSWGIMGSLLQNNMQATFTPSVGAASTTVNMTGMTFGLLGYYDYALSPDFQLRGMGGYEMFGVKGSGGASDCDNSSDCNVSISYLSMYGGAKYNFYNHGMRVWAGASYGFLWALSKSSSVLKTADISSNQLYVFSLGLDYPLKNMAYIPLTVDYGLFPTSATVKANIIFLRAGWGKSF
jgi:hypothetical protein